MAGAHWFVYAAPGRVPSNSTPTGYVDGTLLFICPNTPGVWQLWFLSAPWPYWFLMVGLHAQLLEARTPLPPWVFGLPYQQIYVFQNHQGGTLQGALCGCDLHIHAHPMDQNGRHHIWRSNAVQQDAFWNTDASNAYYVGYEDHVLPANL